jgi:hypothetical protein
MEMQKFRAVVKVEFSNGAIGYQAKFPFDSLGQFAKVQKCPVEGYPDLRLTAYMQTYAATAFSVPATTRYKGEHIAGYIITGVDGPVFNPFDRFLGILERKDGRFTVTISGRVGADRSIGVYFTDRIAIGWYDTPKEAYAARRVAMQEWSDYSEGGPIPAWYFPR